MKGLNINISSCTSQDSTAIISSNMEVLQPSSSSSSSSSFSHFTPGSRAIDRHNPIVTDEKRSGFSSNNNGSCTTTPIGTPRTNHVLQKKPPTPITPSSHPPKKKGNNKLPTLTKKKTSKKNVTTTTSTTKPPLCSSSITDGDEIYKSGRRSYSKPSDLIMKAAACTNARPGVDYISPPESSRYLLDDTSFLEVLSDFDPVLKLMPYNSNDHDNNQNVEVVKPECSKPSSSTGSSDQVVVLRVSLHCRGCERKLKKHLARMPGVTSFNIDFTAKKVTVVGDVTPLGVLTSISKVKTAKLWTPPTAISSSSSQLNSRNIQLNNRK